MRIGLPSGVSLSVSVILYASLSLAAEERITGVIEKTTKEGACCQVRDALKDLYYVEASDEVAKDCNNMLGKKAVVTGTVEKKGEDYFVAAKKVTDAPVIKAPLPELPAKETAKEGPGEDGKDAAKKDSGDAKEIKDSQKDAKDAGSNKAEGKPADSMKEPAEDAAKKGGNAQEKAAKAAKQP